MNATPRLVPCHTIKITLTEVKPLVWRRVQLPSSLRLPAVADILLTAMGWAGTHLWAFERDELMYVPRDASDGWSSPGDVDAEKVSLGKLLPEVGSRVDFSYDFGDGWRHRVVTEAIQPAPSEVKVLAGRNNCPPDDVGGPWGYADFVAAITNVEHPEHQEMLDWVGGSFDPKHFELHEFRVAPITAG